jgi:hypothetical protein
MLRANRETSDESVRLRGGARVPWRMGDGLRQPDRPLSVAATMAIDSTSVYWTSIAYFGNNWVTDESPPGAVMKVPIGGGTPITLASEQTYPVGIATDGTNVYWINNGVDLSGSQLGTVMRMPVDGGVATTLASGEMSPYAIAVDSTSVYWASSACAQGGETCTGSVAKLTPK